MILEAKLKEAKPGQWINFLRGSKFHLYKVHEMNGEATYQTKNVCSMVANGWGRKYHSPYTETRVRIFESEEEYLTWIRAEDARMRKVNFENNPDLPF